MASYQPGQLKPNQLSLTNLCPFLGENDVRLFVAQFLGDDEAVEQVAMQPGKDTQQAVITFKNPNSVTTAGKLEGMMLLGRRLAVFNVCGSLARQREEEEQHEASMTDSELAEMRRLKAYAEKAMARTVCVGNLPPQISEDEIRTIFSEAGAITRVKYDKEKNTAHIEYKKPSAAKAVLHVVAGELSILQRVLRITTAEVAISKPPDVEAAAAEALARNQQAAQAEKPRARGRAGQARAPGGGPASWRN